MTLRRRIRSYKFWGSIAAVLVLFSLAGYVGCGRWWGLAQAADVRLAINTHLLTNPAYRRYARAIRRIESARPTLHIIAESDDDDDLKESARRINSSAGDVPDGQYNISLVARVTLRNSLFKQPIKLTDYVGKAHFELHNGKIRSLWCDTARLEKAALLHERFAAILNATPRDALDTRYPRARLELLDGGACDYRTAKHVEQLFANFPAWYEFAIRRLTHIGFLVPLRETGNFYRRGEFTLTSGQQLGFPQPLTQGYEESYRVCALATILNHFGEPVDQSQTIIAVEQAKHGPVAIREVLRVDAAEFDTGVVNSLLAGHLPLEWINDLLMWALIIAFLFALRFLLGILVQIKTLLPSSPLRTSTGSTKDDDSD